MTEYPSVVAIVTVLPLDGTDPAKDTEPETGAATGLPACAPMSIPRCCPAPYGWPRSNAKNVSTGPSTGQLQPSAGDGAARTAAMRVTGSSNRIRA